MPTPEGKLVIALDYDGTYSADPGLWLEFIKIAQKRGHEVLIATMRTDAELDDMCETLQDRVNRIIPTHRNAKKPFLEGFGIKPDIWIDDYPHFIILDAEGADKAERAEAKLGFVPNNRG